MEGRTRLMEKFTKITGVAAPMPMINVDTDMIIPKQFLKSIKRSGFGPNLFDELRYEDEGQPGQDCSQRPLRAEFPLNQPRYQGASVLLARENFGCGSSREHAPWALDDFGFRSVIAPSFADIFFNNCRKNGILLVVLNESQVQALFEEVTANVGCQLKVDLQQKTVSSRAGLNYSFEIDDFARQCLLGGMDDIGWTLQFEDQIGRFEQESASQTPWLSLSA